MNNLVGIDTEHTRDEPMATEMLRTLVHHYPGHDWHVMVRGGLVHIKNLSINPEWGMAIHYNTVKSDAQERARSVVRSAGEFLERANMKRGKAEGVTAHAVDGIPDNYMVRNRL